MGIGSDSSNDVSERDYEAHGPRRYGLHELFSCLALSTRRKSAHWRQKQISRSVKAAPGDQVQIWTRYPRRPARALVDAQARSRLSTEVLRCREASAMCHKRPARAAVLKIELPSLHARLTRQR